MKKQSVYAKHRASFLWCRMLHLFLPERARYSPYSRGLIENIPSAP
jgi:hypothetical protein